MDQSNFPNLSIIRLDVNPEESRLEQSIQLDLQWQTTDPLLNASWQVEYIVDTFARKRSIELTSLGPFNYDPGQHNTIIQIPDIDLNAVNVNAKGTMPTGLMTVSLLAGQESLLGINMMTQVIEREGNLYKIVISPIE